MIDGILTYGDTRRSDKLGFEETELRLGIGLPAHKPNANHGKRGFQDTHVDLKLNLSSKGQNDLNIKSTMNHVKEKNSISCPNESVKPPPAKAQVVGWPPVRTFRKPAVAAQPKTETEGSAAAFVKVSMDGAPYLRKVDLKMYKTYQELSDALGKMFSSFTIGKCDSEGMMDFMNNESKAKGCEYVPTYEDKDGDWMLVGDVPWEMFVESCKRMRIMKGTDAKGLCSPKAMEKCKGKT